MRRDLEAKDVQADTEVAAMEYAWDQGWSDGLPVVPPTPERVTAFLDYAGLEPDHEVGRYEVRNRVVTAEKVAANAVMAGCKREYLPVVVAAIEAMMDPAFKMNHLASTSSPWPAFIINGPIIRKLGLSSGAGVLGPGSRANITIGRAISLTMANCMDAKVGGVQQGIMGVPSRAAGQVMAENEATSWEPLSVMRGVPRGVSAVTAATNYMHGPQEIVARPDRLPRKDTARAVANMLCEYCAEFSINWVQLIVMSPSMQRVFAAEGWSKRDLKKYLVDNVKASVESLKARHKWLAEKDEEPTVEGSAPIYPGDDTKYIPLGKGQLFGREAGTPVATRPWGDMDYLIVVAGADGPAMHACLFRPYIPAGATTKTIRAAARSG